MNICTTNTHVPFLKMLSLVPDLKMFVFSFRFASRDWNNGYRQKPSNIFHIPVDEPQAISMILPALLGQKVDCIILHSFQDLEIFCGDKYIHPELMKTIKGIRKYYIFHNSLNTEFRGLPAQEIFQRVDNLKKIFAENNVTAVAISKFKAESWNMPCHVIPPGIDTVEFDRSWAGVNNNYKVLDGYPDYSVRVCSNMEGRDFMNGYRAGNQVLAGIDQPAILLGEGNENPRERLPRHIGLLSSSFEHYKTLLRQSRLYLATNVEQYEDWYNLSSLEAIAMGVPVVFTTHNGISRVDNYTKYFPIISEDIGYLRDRINAMFKDYEFAKFISEQSKGFVDKHFSLSAFVSKWSGVLRGGN